MFKPMGAKKTMVLPFPHTCLEEWNTHVKRNKQQMQQLTGSSVLRERCHDARHWAAARIQKHYRRYRERMNLLLKRDPNAPPKPRKFLQLRSKLKAKAKQKVVSASMALGLAFSIARPLEDENTTVKAVEAVVPVKEQEEQLSSRNGKREPSPATAAAAAAATTTTTTTTTATGKKHMLEWVLDTKLNRIAAANASLKSAVEMDCMPLIFEAADKQAESHVMEPVSEESILDTPESVEFETAEIMSSNFVNVMQTSWLVSSVEQRHQLPFAQDHETTSFWRGLVSDLTYVLSSEFPANLNGQTPACVEDHKKLLRKKLAQTCSDTDLKRLDHIFERLHSNMVAPAARCFGYLLTKAWRWMFDGLYVDVLSLQEMQRVLETEYDLTKTRVVLLPTHKSHLDYLIMSYILFGYGLPMPRIAAGNNLDLKGVGDFLRMNGSFFIRRSFRDDPLYKQTLEKYVHTLLEDGNLVEVFAEGGRSRHGRVCKLRKGFLNMFHSYAQAKAPQEHVVVVPITIDYDKVFEVQEYARQLLGKAKVRESLLVLCKSIYALLFERTFGNVYVRFGRPLDLGAQSHVVDQVACETACKLQDIQTITSSGIVAALTLWKRHYLTTEMLHTDVQWLVQLLKQTRSEMTVAPLATNQMVQHALEVLEFGVEANGVVHLVKKIKQQDVNYCPASRALELAYYRNQLVSVFLVDMAVLGGLQLALHAHTMTTASSSHSVLKVPSATRFQVVSLKELVNESKFVLDFLRHICQYQPVDLDHHVLKFVQDQVHCVTTFQVGDETFCIVDCEKWQRNKTVHFVQSLLSPFADSLWILVNSLWVYFADPDKLCSRLRKHHLGPRGWDEKQVVLTAQALGKELAEQKQHSLEHAEALCSETLKQAMEFLVAMNMLDRKSHGPTAPRTLSLVYRNEAFLSLWTEKANALRKPNTFNTALWEHKGVETMLNAENLSKSLVLKLLSVTTK